MEDLFNSVLDTLQGWAVILGTIAVVVLGMWLIWAFYSQQGLRKAVTGVAIILIGILFIGAAPAIVVAIYDTATGL